MSSRRKGEISITYMSGPLDGKTLTFEQPDIDEPRVINIGRRENCDVYLHFDNQVSRLHAQLGCVAKPVTDTGTGTLLSFWLEDSGSRNGTYIEKKSRTFNRASDFTAWYAVQSRQNMAAAGCTSVVRVG